MHELSLSSAILETTLRHAGGRRVTSVQLRVGALRQVVPESLDFYFGIVTRGTACEGSELEQELIPARMRCRECSAEWEPELPIFRCPGCGGAGVDAVQGTEFEIESIMVEEEKEEECIART